jgi:hypothetical protein
MVTTRNFLHTWKRDNLINLAKLHGLTGCSRLRKKVLIDKILDYLIFPTVMFHRLSILDDEEIILFKELLQKDIVVNEENVEVTTSLIKTQYISVKADGYIGLMDGVKENYNRFDHDKFEKNRKKVSWLVKCLEFSNTFYGITPVNVLLDVFNRKPKMRASEEELLRLFHQIPPDLNLSILLQDNFRNLTYSGEDVKRLRNEQQDKEFFIPSHQQIDFYQKHDYFDEPGYREFRAYLTKNTESSFSEIDDILAELFHFSYIDADIQEIMDFLEEWVEFKNEPEMIKLLDLVNIVSNDTRILENRGHTPNETAYMLRSRAKQSKIVKNSTDRSEDSNDFNFYKEDKEKEHKPFVRRQEKIYPNDPCSCGSGRKYKKCCGKK